MARLLILDDDKEILENLVKEISQLYPHISIITYADYDRFLEKQDIIDYQYVLSDVFFGEVNAIEVHNKISKNGKIPVVYMSGNDSSTFDVYDAPHVYFLSKPIDHDKLKKALEKLFNIQNFIKIKAFSSEHVIPFSDILYLESDKRIVNIITKNNLHSTYAKLDDYAYLSDMGFLRIGKSYIVNKQYLKDKYRDYVVLVNGEKLPISRSYQKELQDVL